MRSIKTVAAVLGLCLTALFAVAAQAEGLTGAGATFPAPLYQKWFAEYARETGVQITYRPIGSGGGIKSLTGRAVDFGASDWPLTGELAPSAPGLLPLPIVAGPVALAYNIPGVRPGLRLTGVVLADIYLGRITRWNDPRLARLNPGVRLPGLPIVPCHSRDAHTTGLFTLYLSQNSPAWKTRVGSGRKVLWPVGPGGSGCPGVASLIKQTEGSIGYIELPYAVQLQINCAALRDDANQFVFPSVASATLAAASIATDTDGVPVLAPAPRGYALTGFTYLLVPRVGAKPALKAFLRWALTRGQADAPGLLFAPLPPNVQRQALAAVASMR